MGSRFVGSDRLRQDEDGAADQIRMVVRVDDPVDAVGDEVKIAGAHAPIDGAVRMPELPELLSSDEPALCAGQPNGVCVEAHDRSMPTYLIDVNPLVSRPST